MTSDWGKVHDFWLQKAHGLSNGPEFPTFRGESKINFLKMAALDPAGAAREHQKVDNIPSGDDEQFTIENHHMFHGQTHYFNGHFP